MNAPDNYSDKINKYLNGSMNSAELQEFQKEIASDEFLSDAIEGYKTTAAFPDDLNMIKSKIIPEPKKKKLLTGFVYAGIAAGLTLLAVIFIDSPFDKEYNTGNSVSQTIIQFPEVNDTIQINDTSKSIQIFHNPERSITAELRSLPDRVVVPESIAPLNYKKEIQIENNTADVNFKGYYRYSSNHLYSYIGNYKVIDYRYDKRMNKKNMSIPSNFIDIDVPDTFSESKSEFTYMAFLEQALDKINLKNFDGAIEDFNTILDQYPNDLNAVFYKALCLYETNSNNSSINYFDIALSSKINTFHEESKWYKGLILKEEKQYAAAEKVLEEIVNEQGYYGVQAKKELDELYKIYMNED
jgi:TolA-binding protein